MSITPAPVTVEGEDMTDKLHILKYLDNVLRHGSEAGRDIQSRLSEAKMNRMSKCGGHHSTVYTPAADIVYLASEIYKISNLASDLQRFKYN